MNDNALVDEPAALEVPTTSSGATLPAFGREDMVRLGARIHKVVVRWREITHQPAGLKQSPRFNATQLAHLCGFDKVDELRKRFDEGVAKGLPSGIKGDGSRVRDYSLAEARAWIRSYGKWPRRPEGSPGATVCVTNFKGGVGKTMLTIPLAQGLSLRGYKVLCIDFDPQGSLSSMLGVTPTDLEEEDTVLPLMLPPSEEGARDTLQASIRSTYWDGIDLVPATYWLFAGEFNLPSRQRDHKNEPNFKFYNVLKNALDAGILDEYDYVLIDTPPAISYMTMVALYAADALLLPLPPEGIDFASSAQFWTLLSELFETTAKMDGQEKQYRWMRAVPSKVDNNKLHVKGMKELMALGYRELLMPTEIPETAAVRVGGSKLQSIYDISKYEGDRRTLLRAKEAYDKFVDGVDALTHQTIWAKA